MRPWRRCEELHRIAADSPDLVALAINEPNARDIVTFIDRECALHVAFGVHQYETLGTHFFGGQQRRLRVDGLSPDVMREGAAEKAGYDRESQIQFLHGTFLRANYTPPGKQKSDGQHFEQNYLL
jgi:hypothetical protein